MAEPGMHKWRQEVRDGCTKGFNRGIVFLFFGNEALSARMTIAELWDGRMRGGHWSGSSPPEEGWPPPEEASQEAPMPGHLIQGGDTRRVIPRGHPRSGYPPYPCHGGISPECIGRDRRTGIGVRREWNRGIGCVGHMALCLIPHPLPQVPEGLLTEL